MSLIASGWERVKTNYLLSLGEMLSRVPKNRFGLFVQLPAVAFIACILPMGDAVAAKNPGIEIQIESARPRLTAGAALPVNAIVTNVSDSVVHLHEQHITMSPPPELVGQSFPAGWWAHFPTELHPGKDDEYYDVPISIRPGESYKVFWYLDPKQQTEKGDGATSFVAPLKNIYRTITTELGFLFFVPGDYTITVAAKYWVDPEKPTTGKYHTQVASKTLNVESPQTVILFGAGLGGLIAYFLLPKARRRLIESGAKEGQPTSFSVKVASKDLVGILGAMLWSAIATILLARVSETQFLIRVTVADFWGAVAIGFIANTIGIELIDKYIQKKRS